ncbi:MAG: DUF11 domain-containing protein, partial [Desulfopila sp.]|nr:DUF11 domain-containing protein [Desulfopila sp.]
MQNAIPRFSAVILCFLLLTLSAQAAYAAADIQPTSFLANPDPVPARGEVVYTIVVKSNDQADPVTNGWLEVPLPADFSFLSVNNANCSYSGNVPSTGAAGDLLRCDWTTITFEEVVVLTARVPDVTGIYPLTATTGADEDSNPSNDSETVNTQAVTSADLELTAKTGNPDPAPGGSIVTYDFSVINNGPYNADSLVLTDLLPPGLTFVGDNAAPAADQDGDWSCSAIGQEVTCTAASLAVSSTSVFHFRDRVTQASTGAITNAASVDADTLDPIPDNNTATDDLTVVEGTDMAITKSVITSPVIGGEPVRFSLSATNNGPMSAAAVEVRDTLPTGYTDITLVSTPAGWTCSSENPVIICTIPSVDVGTTAAFIIEATPATVSEAVIHQNSAQVSTTTDDAVNSNDNITVNYTVNPDIADLSITKTKGPNPVAQGSEIASTIVVRNHGPRPADPVQVVDVLSNGETYTGFTGNNWSCVHDGNNPGGTVTCDYGAVPLAD